MSKSQGYKGVECQSLVGDVEEKSFDNYKVVGFCSSSISGNAMNLHIKLDGKKHIYTISKADIIDMFRHRVQICAIEYTGEK